MDLERSFNSLTSVSSLLFSLPLSYLLRETFLLMLTRMARGQTAPQAIIFGAFGA
jgi:hypothetical protein